MQQRQNHPGQQTESASTFHVPAYKLTPPIGSSSLVPRTRVGEQIRQAEGAKLILVRAPAGFGKTTVMLQYHADLKARGIATAWLNLDAADNDLGRFVTDLAVAFRRIDPAFTSDAPGANDVDGFTLDLLTHIGASEGRFVLFLDEFETIQNPTVQDIIRRLLPGLPPGGSVVIGSRDIPDLGLGRLRAHGQLLEIGPAGLRFSLDETVCLMRDKRCIALGDAEIAKLQRCTEGWAAALQLAALSLADRDDHQGFVATFSGSNADIADYLAEDVLERQDAEVRDFLLKTSLLKELTPALCDAVTQRSDSRQMLGRLERSNLFLIPLDSERRWYRYHSIFADFLKAQLEQMQQADIAILYRRAADWYAEQGRMVPAIDHALASGLFEFALPLLERHAKHLLWQGRVRLLTRWIDSLPPAALAPYLELRLVYAWALCLTNRYRDAVAQLEALDGKGDQDFEARVMAVQTLALAMADRADECYRNLDRTMSLMPSLEPFTFGVVANVMAYCLITANQIGDARRLLDQAKDSHARLGATFSMAVSESIEGVIDMVQGRLRNATASLRSAFSRMQARGSGSIGGRGTVSVPLAVALYEADEITESEGLITDSLPFIRQTGTPDSLISAHLVLARIALLRGDRSAALQRMSELEYLGHQNNLQRAVATAWLERSRIAVRQGDLAAAQEYLQNADKPEVWTRFAQFPGHANEVDTIAIGRARLLMRQGNTDAAIDLLRQEIVRAEALLRHRRALKLNVLLAEALQAAGDGKAAQRVMADALRFASKEGFIRTFIDEGDAVLRLVREVRAAGAPDIDPAFFDRILGPDTAAAVEPETRADAPSLVDPLTDREIQVLQLLAEGHPNRVLADRLFVTETTVKAHLRNINTKLAARNRTDAVAIARRAGLIR